MQNLTNRAISHGEAWADVTVWGHLLDIGYLGSPSLTLDRYVAKSCSLPTCDTDLVRRELRIAVKTTTHKHDGIVRRLLSVGHGLDLAFIEMKPERLYPTTTHRAKVLESMVATLRSHNVEGVMVAGILCSGRFVALQASSPTDKLSIRHENHNHQRGVMWRCLSV